MKLVRYDGDELGLLAADGDGIVSLTDRLGVSGPDPLLDYARGDHDASRYADEPPDVAASDVRLEPPVGEPGKIVAAPANYAEHKAEMSGGPAEPPTSYFLKAPTSVVGPDDAIELPYADRRVDHEVELALVLGEDLRDATPATALEAVLGYTVLVDVSMRGEEDRSHRKSYDTFTVVGPCVATPEAVGDPLDLHLELAVNGEVRQDATTADMLRPPAEFLAIASTGTTLRAGDVVTTGTPSGVGPLEDGDVVRASVEGIGSMTVDVRGSDLRYADTLPEVSR